MIPLMIGASRNPFAQFSGSFLHFQFFGGWRKRKDERAKGCVVGGVDDGRHSVWTPFRGREYRLLIGGRNGDSGWIGEGSASVGNILRKGR